MTAIARRVVVAALLVAGTACSGASATPSAEPAARTGDVHRAAAQLQLDVVPATGAPDEIWGHVLDLPIPAPDFELTAADGSAFDFARDADAPLTLLYFGYTSCPDVCPTHLAALSHALREMTPEQRRMVDVVFVSVDPTVDTPQRLDAYLDSFDPAITGLTGTPGQVNDALASIGLPRTAIGPDADEPPEHPSSVLGYTADGTARVVWPFGTTPRAYAHDMRLLLDDDRSSGP